MHTNFGLVMSLDDRIVVVGRVCAQQAPVMHNCLPVTYHLLHLQAAALQNHGPARLCQVQGKELVEAVRDGIAVPAPLVRHHGRAQQISPHGQKDLLLARRMREHPWVRLSTCWGIHDDALQRVPVQIVVLLAACIHIQPKLDGQLWLLPWHG